MNSMENNENPCLGSSFDSYLEEHGVLEETKENAFKLYLAYKVSIALQESNISHTELAKLMKISKAEVHHMLNPTNPLITLADLSQIAHALDKNITLDIE